MEVLNDHPMPEQTSFNFGAPAEKPAPTIPTPPVEEAVVPTMPEQETEELPFLDSSLSPDTTPQPTTVQFEESALSPILKTEEGRLFLIEQLENPLSASYKKFQESSLAGRLKILDSTLPQGEMTYTQMIETFNPNAMERSMLGRFESPKTTETAIRRRYDTFLRRQIEPNQPAVVSTRPSLTPHTPQVRRGLLPKGPTGGHGKDAAAGNDR